MSTRRLNQPTSELAATRPAVTRIARRCFRLKRPSPSRNRSRGPRGPVGERGPPDVARHRPVAQHLRDHEHGHHEVRGEAERRGHAELHEHRHVGEDQGAEADHRGGAGDA